MNDYCIILKYGQEIIWRNCDVDMIELWRKVNASYAEPYLNLVKEGKIVSCIRARDISYVGVI